MMSVNNGRLGEKNEWELPHLRESHQIPDTGSMNGDFWDVKFYPYSDVGEIPIFVAVGSQYILVCRTPEEKNIQVLLSIQDEEDGNENYACAWSKDLETGTPILCVAGSSGKIKVINALTGELLRVLAGHGGDINSLEVSPVNPHILASGSVDCTVRIWTLDPIHKKQPCAAILAGDGHRETILSVAFHATGRYLLSSGIDHVINLWVLPELPNERTGTHKPTRIHYPHFSTSEVHSAIVDCVTFHNDLILSKAERESCIVLWSISGFSSLNPPPPPLSAPTAHDQERDTRTAFTTTGPPYTRLLQLSIPDVDIMFMRFGLFPGTVEGSRGPVLAMANTASKVFFWDLARLEEYWDYISSLPPSSALNSNTNRASAPVPTIESSTSFSSTSSHNLDLPKRPRFLIPFRPRVRGGGRIGIPSHRMRDTSPTESDRSTPTTHSNLNPSSTTSGPSAAHPNPKTEQGKESQYLEKSKEVWGKRYGIDSAEKELTAHKEEVVRGLSFVGRTVAWSPGGEWCVVVGSAGVLVVLERWEKMIR